MKLNNYYSCWNSKQFDSNNINKRISFRRVNSDIRVSDLLRVSVIRRALYRESQYLQHHAYHLLKHALSSLIFHGVLSNFQYLKLNNYSTCWKCKHSIAIFLSMFILLKYQLIIQFMLFSDGIYLVFGKNLPFFLEFVSSQFQRIYHLLNPS